MTLVVGRIEGPRIYIESDTRIDDPKKTKTNPLLGLVKAVRLHPQVVLCFAGNVHYASLTLRRVREHGINNHADLFSLLEELHQQSEMQTDFAVASLHENRPEFHCIRGGSYSINATSFWIGDALAFEAYQKAYHTLPESQYRINGVLETDVRMRLAFQSVMNDAAIPSVGDFQISIGTDTKTVPGFHHMGYIRKIEIHPNENFTISGRDWVSLKNGTSESGAFGVSYFAPRDLASNCVAMHFPHANFGVLFDPAISDAGIIIREKDAQNFIDHIQKLHGIALTGFDIRSDAGFGMIAPNA